MHSRWAAPVLTRRERTGCIPGFVLPPGKRRHQSDCSIQIKHVARYVTHAARYVTPLMLMLFMTSNSGYIMLHGTNPGLGLQPVLSLRVRTGAAHLGAFSTRMYFKRRMQGIFGEREGANMAEEFNTGSDHAPDVETGESEGLLIVWRGHTLSPLCKRVWLRQTIPTVPYFASLISRISRIWNRSRNLFN